MSAQQHPTPTTSEAPPSATNAFVQYIIARCNADNGIRAALTRAENPSTQYQSWEVLAAFHVNLEVENIYLPHATIASALARTKAETNGTLTLGKAIARCYEDGNMSDQAKAKLRRVLACDSVAELCRVLRPLLRLMEGRGGISLDYALLLKQLLAFGYEDAQQRIKARWAQDFYNTQRDEEVRDE